MTYHLPLSGSITVLATYAEIKKVLDIFLII